MEGEDCHAETGSVVGKERRECGYGRGVREGSSEEVLFDLGPDGVM